MVQGDNKSFLVCKKKMVTAPEVLCGFCAAPFRKFMQIVANMKFDEEPDYAKLISLFESLIDPCTLRPIKIDGALKVVSSQSLYLIFIFLLNCGYVSNRLARRGED